MAAALLLAPTVLGRSSEAPLPPINVQAVATDAGAIITWQPPLHDGGHPITAYSIHRLQADGIGWDEIGTVRTDASSFTDLETLTGMVSFYYVLSYNEAGSSPQSQPASTSMVKPAMCSPAGVTIALPPGVAINWDCLPAEAKILRLPGGQ